jgi:DNA-binding winged helix-turn-helix (wHTH) protein
LSPAPAAQSRYVFDDFVLSPSRRALFHVGREVPLIPRYFDLLVLLVRKREIAVARAEILDAVWADVVVSEGALTQAVRTLRRVLGDDPREPRYIRTVSRHGYRFVHEAVVEEPDEGAMGVVGTMGVATLASCESPNAASTSPRSASPTPRAPGEAEDAMDAELERLLAPGPLDTADRREAAERLHALGTEASLRRFEARLGHPRARAMLRDSRWDVAAAGPILGTVGAVASATWLVRLRLARAIRLAGHRFAGAALGAALAGQMAGFVGGLVLVFGPGSLAAWPVAPVLSVVGAVLGALGAAGVAAGLVLAEVLARSWRRTALVSLGGAGGAIVGASAHLVGNWTLQGLFGRALEPALGGLEGMALGAATGLGYALATRRDLSGMAAPRGAARLRTALAAGACAGAAGLLLAATGRHLGGMSLDLLAHGFPGSQVGLEPLARLLGEATAGERTAMVIGAWEGLLFAFGTILGLTRRPRVNGGQSEPLDEGD